jgi:hypothetical protein
MCRQSDLTADQAHDVVQWECSKRDRPPWGAKNLDALRAIYSDIERKAARMGGGHWPIPEHAGCKPDLDYYDRAFPGWRHAFNAMAQRFRR